MSDTAGVRSGMAAIFDTMADMLGDAGGEDDLDGLGWPAVNQFHRAAERVGRELDRNAVVRCRGWLGRGGSAVRSGVVEKLTAEGVSQVDRRNIFETMRDMAAELFEVHTGSAWRPRSGSEGQPQRDDRRGHRLARFHLRPPLG